MPDVNRAPKPVFKIVGYLCCAHKLLLSVATCYGRACHVLDKSRRYIDANNLTELGVCRNQCIDGRKATLIIFAVHSARLCFSAPLVYLIWPYSFLVKALPMFMATHAFVNMLFDFHNLHAYKRGLEEIDGVVIGS